MQHICVSQVVHLRSTVVWGNGAVEYLSRPYGVIVIILMSLMQLNKLYALYILTVLVGKRQEKILHSLRKVGKEIDESEDTVVAIAWLLSHAAGVVPLIGSTNIDHVNTILKAFEVCSTVYVVTYMYVVLCIYILMYVCIGTR